MNRAVGHRGAEAAAVIGVLMMGAPDDTPAQSLEAAAGAAFTSPDHSALAFGFTPHLPGPLAVGLSLVRFGSSDASLWGGSLDLFLFRGGRSRLYGAASVAGGWLSGDQTGDWGSWSAGAGLELIRSPFIIAAEARYRTFPDLEQSGPELTIRLAIPLGHSAASTSPPAASPAALSAVQAALRAMGTPYVWGGTDQNGFDCSGLIQYAWGQQGVALPRRSIDQARAGRAVEPRLDRLLPGDILTFATAGPGVSHVGLYLGEDRFIHSSSRGVVISRLVVEDPAGRWWRDRWVGARRVGPGS
jgi:cell wall-associated NlpC family hydrolase